MTQTTFNMQSVTKVIGLEEIESTQFLARALAPNEEHGTLILACCQTGAFDNYNKTFSAKEGGVYFSLILKPSKELDLSALTRGAMHSVADTLKNVFELKTKCSADGTVFVWNKQAKKYQKIACLWAEENEAGAVLVHALICVNNPLTLAQKGEWVSLKNLIGTDTSKELFLDDVLNNFWKEYAFL